MIYILLADGFEESETLKAMELMRRSGLNVATVSAGRKKRVVGVNGMTVIADALISEIKNTDGARRITLSEAEDVDASPDACAPSVGAEEPDPLFYSALEIAVENRSVSTSYLQRYLEIGYGRAVRMLDAMEKMGIVGPPNGSKPRAVLMDKEQYQVWRREQGLDD